MLITSISVNENNGTNDFILSNMNFGKQLNNKVIYNSLFTPISYSTSLCNFINIYIAFQLNINLKHICENKYCKFDVIRNIHVIESLSQIERDILFSYQEMMSDKKKPIFVIANELSKAQIKLTNTTLRPNTTFMLKISGIWENNSSYGLSYKYSVVQRTR